MLLFPNWERVSAAFHRHGITISPAVLRHAETVVKFRMDDARRMTGTSDADRGSQMFNGVLDMADVPQSAARDAALRELYAYHTEHNLWDHVPPDVKPALRRLRASGLTLAVVSNANGTVGKAFERTGLRECFDAVGDSHIEGVEKPDPRFFDIVLQRTHSRAETTLHVGDLYHVDVIGARRAGLRAMLYDPDGLYGAFDVMRVRSLGELAEAFEMREKAVD